MGARVRALRIVLCLLLVTRVAAAQLTSGTVQGVASRDEDGSVIPFALIRLQPVGPTPGDTLSRQGITTATGRFRFENVAPGSYQIQLLRIGFRPVTSPILAVLAGATLQYELRAPTNAVQLPTVTVRPGDSCLTANRLPQDPSLETLWREVQKGVQLRHAFELQYRFTRLARQEGTIDWRLGSRPLRKTDTLINDPDSVVVRDERRRATSRAEGYAKGGLLVVPNEKDVVNDDFLRDHCLETPPESGEGELGLRFRPVQQRRDGVAIRGKVWVDATTYMIRRLEVEWLRGTDAVGRTRIDYADMDVGGGRFRLPASGHATARPSGLTRTLIRRAVVSITYEYLDFHQVR
jgi:Carboxypeptidase regulatory-like domain